MMRITRTALFHAAFVGGTMLLAADARGQPLPQGQDCTGQPGVAWGAQIKSCTALIQSAQGNAHDQAVAYKNRGNAYGAEHETDRAMADYNEAIKLDPNFALAYVDRGSIFMGKNDYDHAVADFSEAIRLDPKLVLAYNDRSGAYSTQGDFDLAISDTSEAIRLDPKSAVAYSNRGVAYEGKGDFDRAIADFDAEMPLEPQSRYPYFNRGVANLIVGALPNALADLQQASTLDPTYAYTALWLDIAETRSKMASTLLQASAKFDMTAWPAPVVRMFLGQMTPAAVLAAAGDPDATIEKGQVCEANFYAGQLALRQQNAGEAARLFRIAASDCPKGFTEWAAANAELKTLATAH